MKTTIHLLILFGMLSFSTLAKQNSIISNRAKMPKILAHSPTTNDTTLTHYYKLIKVSKDSALLKKKQRLADLLEQDSKDFQKIAALARFIGRLENQTDSISIYLEALDIISANKENANRRTLQYLAFLDKGKSIQEAREQLNYEEAVKDLNSSAQVDKAAIEELETRAEASIIIFDYKDAIVCYQALITDAEEKETDPLKIANYYMKAGLAQVEYGKYGKALLDQQKALTLCEGTLDQKHPDLAITYANIGNTCHHLKKYNQALEYQKNSITILEQIPDLQYPDLVQTYNDIATTYRFLKEHKLELEFREKSITILNKIVEPKHPHLVEAYNDIAMTYRYLLEHETALKFQQKAIGAWEEMLDAKHYKLAKAYRSTGNIYHYLKQYEKAQEYHQKSIHILEENLVPKHPYLATSYYDIGRAYQSNKEYDKALKYHQKSIDIREEILRPRHKDLAKSYYNIATTYRSIKQYEKAIEFNQKCIQIRDAIFDPNHNNLATAYTRIGYNYRSIKQYKKALKYHQKSLRIRKVISEPEKLATSYYNIGNTYLSMKKYKKALKIHQKSLDQWEGSAVWNSIGLCNYYLGKYSNAMNAYQKAANLSPEIKEQHFYNNMGTAYVKNKQYDKAKVAFETYEKLFPKEGRPQRNWAMYYALQNENKKALSYLQKAIDLGFDDLDWFKTDDSMDSLREEPLFKEMINNLKKKESEKSNDQK